MHPRSYIKVFTGHSVCSQGSKASSGGQQRLISVRGRAGWSKSSLGAHAILWEMLCLGWIVFGVSIIPGGIEWHLKLTRLYAGCVITTTIARRSSSIGNGEGVVFLRARTLHTDWNITHNRRRLELCPVFFVCLFFFLFFSSIEI